MDVRKHNEKPLSCLDFEIIAPLLNLLANYGNFKFNFNLIKEK